MDHPKTVCTIAPPPTSARLLRVASYCRTSTCLDSQKTSLASQRTHYRDAILANPAWELAGIYVEAGVSATGVSARPELQRLIADCQNGLVDLVITKSISRLARNTADCLAITRLLTSHGVALWFEKENIRTDREESELMLALLSALAQDESRSLSANVKWGIRRRFEAGTYLPPRAPYGYRKLGRTFEVCPQEAAVVRGIFAALLEGEAPATIAQDLNARGVPTWTQTNRPHDVADGSSRERKTPVQPDDPHGVQDKPCNQWWPSTVRDMAQNPFYTGDVRYQKTFVDDQYHKQTNTGQLAQPVHRGHHPAIVSHDTFARANEALARRGASAGSGVATGGAEEGAPGQSAQTSPRKRKRRYCFSGKLVCAACGATLYRGGAARSFYRCANRSPASGSPRCVMPAAYVEDLQNALATMFNKLAFGEKRLHLLEGYAGDKCLEAGEPSAAAATRRQALGLRADLLARGVRPAFGADDAALFLRHVDKAIVWSRRRVECHFACGLLLTESLVPTEAVWPAPAPTPPTSPASAPPSSARSRKPSQGARTVPFGYRMRGGRVVSDPDEHRQLTALFRAFVVGDSLNACRAKAGIARTAQTCKRMLSNGLYVGAGQYPQLVSPELFRSAQNELARREEARSQQSRALPKRRCKRRVPVITNFRILSDDPGQGTPAAALPPAAAHAARKYARIQGVAAASPSPAPAPSPKGGRDDSANN